MTTLTSSHIAGTLQWEPLVSSWYKGEWLADVPVSDGSIVWSTAREVPGSVSLTVPRLMDGFDWLPRETDSRHPLAADGQTLHISIRVTLPVSRQVVIMRRGTMLVEDWDEGGGSLSVVGLSMFQRIVENRLTLPIQSRTGATLASEARRLVPASMGLYIDPALTDRDCPRRTWGEDRMENLREIADMWPARLRESVYGEVMFLAPLPDVPTPTETLTDGEGGTVVSAYTSGTRKGVYNVVVARGTETDDAGAPLIQAVQEQLSGKYKADPDGFGYVPYFMSSPLITSHSIAQSAARTRLGNVVRRARTVPVVCATDPRRELDEALEIVTEEGSRRVWGYTSGTDLPLVVRQGMDMRVDVEVA